MHPFTHNFLTEISKRDVFHPISNQIEVLSEAQASAKRKALDNKVDEASVFLSTLDSVASNLEEKEMADLKMIANAARCLMYCSDHFQEILWTSQDTQTKKESPRSLFDKMVSPKEHIEKLTPFLDKSFEKAFNDIAAQLICALHNVHALALAYTKNFEHAKEALTAGLAYSQYNPALSEILMANLARIEQESLLCAMPSERLMLVSYSATERTRANSAPAACAEEELAHRLTELKLDKQPLSFVK